MDAATGGLGLPHTANMLTFLFHLHARAATECMRPKVILRRLERHRELQRLRVSGELAEAREGRLERRRELRQLRVFVASYEANGI